MHQGKHEKGQTLILIALAVIGLVAFTALAVDGSMVFSDRRHSQNASDTAAFAAALARVRSNGDWRQAGLDRAASNDYANDGTTEVEVYLCSEWQASSGTPCDGLPGGADPSEYVLVRIKSVVRLFFAPVIGRGEVTNHTSAIVHASLPETTQWYDGRALVSTMAGCPPTGYPHDPFTVMGNSGTTVIYSGILVNSNCEFPVAYDQGGSSLVRTDNGVCVVGDAHYTNTLPPPNQNCTPIDPNKYVLPANPTCSQNGQIAEVSSKNYEATPGNYDSPFPNVSPAGTLKLKRGIYCFKAGINLQSTWNITTDLNGNGQHDSDSEGVFFYVPPKATGKPNDVTFNGTSYVNIHAVSVPFAGFDSMYLNYLMYVPATNQATIKITGSDGSSFTGTILAPTSHIALSGGSTTSGGVDTGAVTIDAQIIGYSVAIAGNGTLRILYNQANNAVTTTNPALSATK